MDRHSQHTHVHFVSIKLFVERRLGPLRARESLLAIVATTFLVAGTREPPNPLN